MISLMIVTIALTCAGYSATLFTEEVRAIILISCVLSDLHILTRLLSIKEVDK